MSVKQNQIYAELGDKRRYLRVEEVTDTEATCTAGWRARQGIVWSKRRPTFALEVLTDLSLFRLEADA